MPAVRRKRCTGCGRLPKKGESGKLSEMLAANASVGATSTNPRDQPTDSGFKNIKGKWYKNSYFGLQPIDYVPTIQQQMRGHGFRVRKHNRGRFFYEG